MKRLALCLLGVLTAVLAAAPTAGAGAYSVHFCASGGTIFDNRSWSPAVAPGYRMDSVCPQPNHNISIEVPRSASAKVPENTSSSLVFNAPAGTTIGDFRFDRYFGFQNNVAASTHPFYAAYLLGGTVFAGAGDFDASTVNRLRATGDWYSGTQRRETVTKSSFRSLAGYRNDARSLVIQVGCFPRGTPCSHTGGEINNALFGASVDLIDNVPPAVAVEAFGLLAGGTPTGTEPIRFAASDNAGVRTAEIVDVTNPASPQVVASEDYASVRNDRGNGCSFRLTRPCPNLSGETIASPGITGGRRQISLRITDVGGNQTASPPTTVNVVPPFDRGPLNGGNATETGKVEVRYKATRRRSRTVNFRSRVRVRGRVLNASGVPVTNAVVHILRKDERTGSTWRKGGDDLRTDSKGRFTTRLRATASRAWQFAWPSHVNDPQPAASGHLRLRARATGRLSVRPRHIRTGDAARFRGKLRGYGFPRSGVPVEIQAFQRGRWRAVRTKRTNRKGRFSHRFCCFGSGRRRIRFRARILTDSRFPYERGLSNIVRRRIN